MTSHVNPSSSLQFEAHTNAIVFVKEIGASTRTDNFRRTLQFFLNEANGEVSVKMYGDSWRDDQGIYHGSEEKYVGEINARSISFKKSDGREFYPNLQEKRSILTSLTDNDFGCVLYNWRNEISLLTISTS